MAVQCMVLYALAFPLQVWFVDGTVKCFTGGHIPLGSLGHLLLVAVCGGCIHPSDLLLSERGTFVKTSQ